MAELGYVGLGVMGGGDRPPPARRRARRHRSGTARARRREPLLAAGARWADSPREVTERSDVVFTMVTNTAAVQAVTEGAGRHPRRARAGQGLRRHEHGEPGEHARARRAGRGRRRGDARRAGLGHVDHRSSRGRLSIMVGGDDDAFERVKPVLEAIGPKVFHLGPSGSAVTMKIAINLSLAVQMLAFSEGVLLAEKSGIAREQAVEVMLASRDRLADGRVPRAVRARAARRGVVRLPHDAEGPESRARARPRARGAAPDDGGDERAAHRRERHGRRRRDFAVLFDVLAAMSGVETEVLAMSATAAQPTRRRRARPRDVPADDARSASSRSRSNELYRSAKMPGLTHLYIGEEAVAVGVCSALRRDDYITSHAPRPRALPRQGRGRRAHVRRAARQGGRLLPRQGRLDAHRRPRERQPRRERDRRRLDGHRDRRRVLGEAARHRPGRGLLLRRRRARPGARSTR